MEAGAYFCVKVRLSNQVIMGRLLRSLYVGRITEYLSPVLAPFFEAIAVNNGLECRKRQVKNELGATKSN